MDIHFNLAASRLFILYRLIPVIMQVISDLEYKNVVTTLVMFYKRD